MTERVASLGYAALKKQTVATTAVTPDTYVPYYSQSLNTNNNLMTDMPVYGNKFDNFASLPGQRSHGGSITVMAEPDTAARWWDMLLTKGTTTGANPYTHPFTLASTDPNPYTLDVSYGSQVIRFIGVSASNITPTWQEDKMQYEIELSALSSFNGREVLSIVTTTVNLVSTNNDTTPTAGLVAGDLVSVVKIDGSTRLDTTIASITNGTTVVLGATAAAYAAGDMLVLRPATPSLSTKTPFLWSRTQLFFSDTAANALTASATVGNQTRVEKGSEFSVNHSFEDGEGSKRSGSFDPASLVRTTGGAALKIKKFFDTADEFKYWNALTKRACVIRAYSETGYEMRITFNNIKTMSDDTPTEAGGVIYHEVGYAPQFDTADGQGIDVKIINAVVTI